MAKSLGKTITSIVIMSAVTLSIAAAAVGIHAMNRNPAADDGSGNGIHLAAHGHAGIARRLVHQEYKTRQTAEQSTQ